MEKKNQHRTKPDEPEYFQRGFFLCQVKRAHACGGGEFCLVGRLIPITLLTWGNLDPSFSFSHRSTVIFLHQPQQSPFVCKIRWVSQHTHLPAYSSNY